MVYLEALALLGRHGPVFVLAFLYDVIDVLIVVVHTRTVHAPLKCALHICCAGEPLKADVALCNMRCGQHLQVCFGKSVSQCEYVMHWLFHRQFCQQSHSISLLDN